VCVIIHFPMRKVIHFHVYELTHVYVCVIIHIPMRKIIHFHVYELTHV